MLDERGPSFRDAAHRAAAARQAEGTCRRTGEDGDEADAARNWDPLAHRAADWADRPWRC
jgi:hypothetical protein